jgi:hypothetical protein
MNTQLSQRLVDARPQFDELIYAYTREQALEDGVLVDANVGEFAEVTRQFFKIPVAMTAALFDLIKQAVDNPDWCNDYKGVWHDICWMAFNQSKRHGGGASVTFLVIITGTGRKRNHWLRATVGATGPSDPSPCMTVMLARED